MTARHIDVDALRNEIGAVVDGATGRVGVDIRVHGAGRIEIDSDSKFPAASISKLGVLLAALDQAERGVLDLDDDVEIDRAADVGGYGVLIELPSIQRLRLRELLALMIAFSDNTATNRCIDVIGLDAVDRVLRDRGLDETRLGRRLMDLEAEARGVRNEVSARDAAAMLELLVGDTLSPAMRNFADNLLGRQRVRDRLPRRTPADVSVGNKTGELHGIRHDVGIMRGGSGTAVVAVLTHGFTDERTRARYDGGEASDMIATIGSLVGRWIR